MFEASLKLGKDILRDAKDEVAKKDRFLKSQAIIPKAVEDGNATGDREVVINLDTEKGEIDIYLGDQLISTNRDQFLGFQLLGRRSRKIYFSTNNLYYHLISIDEMITYIRENADNRYPEFSEYLSELREQFYQKDKNENWKLNPDLLQEGLKNKYYKYFEGKDDIRDSFEELVSKDILGSTKKSFVDDINIFTLKIDGVRAHEKDFYFSQEYSDVVYYERQGRFFDSSESMVRGNSVCSGCQKQKKVTGKIDIPTKFYITDKPTFFEDLEDKNAYRSFALCEDCYQKLMVGIDHIQHNYSDRLFGTNYFLIPKSQDISELDKKMFLVNRFLTAQPKNLEEELEKHVDLVETMKEENLRFDLLFHWTPPGQGAAFVVAEYISDVEYKNMDRILQTFRSFELGFYSALPFRVGLLSVYWLLFPNKKSHNNPDTDLYRKELLQTFKVLLKGGSLSYRTLLDKFLFIFKKTKHKKQELDFNFFMRPLQMHMLLFLFSKHSNLQGLTTMDSQIENLELEDEKIRDFFETHSEMYQSNPHRQGLVLLGVLMNQILKKQTNQDKSSTIIDKLNFDGMPVRRMPKFINEISNYLHIYNVLQFNDLIHAAMIDRLQNIKNSSISKDEVVFYLLTGISLSKYIGHKHKQEEELKEATNE